MTMAGPSPLGPSGGLSGGDRDLRVPPTRLPEQGGGPRAALAALVVVIALLAAGVGAARLFPESTPHPYVPAPAPGTVPAATPSPIATPAGPPLALPPRMSASDLTRAVKAGRLDGRLVFVDGHLEVIQLPCDQTPAPDHTCILLAVQGLNLPVNAGASALPWQGDPSSRALLVLVADRRRGLTYLGSLVPASGGSESLSSLTGRLLDGGLSDPPRNLFDVRGDLVIPVLDGCSDDQGSPVPCGSPEPYLLDPAVSGDGQPIWTQGAMVDVPSSAVDLEASPSSRGIFLVAPTDPTACLLGNVGRDCTGTGIRWTVVARYVPERAVRVVIP